MKVTGQAADWNDTIRGSQTKAPGPASQGRRGRLPLQDLHAASPEIPEGRSQKLAIGPMCIVLAEANPLPGWARRRPDQQGGFQLTAIHEVMVFLRLGAMPSEPGGEAGVGGCG